MKHIEHVIKCVEAGSIAEELELEPGDTLLQINGTDIKDVFDYHYLINDDNLTMIVRKKNGEEWELDIEKDFDEDLGIEFEQGLMDDYKSCKNKCFFCFIDQNPPGMRETIYFKDDDARLSFLQGNYITLTNMKEEDIKRIIQYHLAPVNISVHTTNPELRVKMLNNRFAGDVLDKIKRLYDAGLEMNSQIVLCKGINDGEELDRSIKELSQFLPYMSSLSVVPVGLAKFRDGLAPLEKFEPEDARKVLELIHSWQEHLLKEHGTRFVFASDEWYINAGMSIPEESYYEGYGQIENGVGMVRSLYDEVVSYLDTITPDDRVRSVSLVTGVLASNYIKDLAKRVADCFPNVSVTVYPIINHFYGENITVTGLLTGTDIIEQLKDKDLYDVLLLPDVMLRSGEDVLLDDIHVPDMEKALQTRIDIVQSNGKSFVDSILGND